MYYLGGAPQEAKRATDRNDQATGEEKRGGTERRETIRDDVKKRGWEKNFFFSLLLLFISFWVFRSV